MARTLKTNRAKNAHEIWNGVTKITNQEGTQQEKRNWGSWMEHATTIRCD